MPLKKSPSTLVASVFFRETPQHFHPELAATVANTWRQRQAGGICQIANVVSQIDGFPIDNSPRRLEAMMNALIAINVLRIDFNRIADEMFFGFSGPATGRCL